jgi:hypothetical protein
MITRKQRVLDVDLCRHVHDDDGEMYAEWSAEWGLRDDSVGTEDSSEDLRQLIADVISDGRRWTDRYELTIAWTLSGDADAGKTVWDMVTELGATLPATCD